MKTYILLLLFTLSLWGCATPPAPIETEPPIPGNLLQLCPALTPLADGSKGTVLQKLLELAALYHECSVMHEKLVEAENGRRHP